MKCKNQIVLSNITFCVILDTEMLSQGSCADEGAPHTEIEIGKTFKFTRIFNL